MKGDILDSVILRLAGIGDGSSLAKALEERQLILELSEQSRASVLTPAETGGLTSALRAALAARCAAINDEAELAAHYQAMLEQEDGCDAALLGLCDPRVQPPTEPWLSAVVRHFDLLTKAPQNASKADVEQLLSAGVASADVVRLTQLAGFLSYEVRVITGLRLLVRRTDL